MAVKFTKGGLQSYQTEFEKSKLGQAIRSGGSSSQQQVQTKTEIYESNLLKQSFASKEAMEKAEQEYKQQQAIANLRSKLTTQQALRGKDLSAQQKVQQELISKVTQVKTGQESIDKQKSKLGFDTSTYSGRLKYQLIEKDPILRRLAERIKRYEETKQIKTSPLFNPQQTQEKKGNGFSITQKYFEGVGKVTEKLGLGGISFYKKGEREQIIKDVLSEFNNAKTYEAQQQAINNLRNKGIKVEEVNGEYKINLEDAYKNIAPTNKLGNIIVGTTDIVVKGKIFSPYMSTGAVKKGSAKVKVVQKTKEATKKLKDLTNEEYSAYINKIRVTKTTQELREAYSKAIKSGNRELIKDSEKILKDVLGETTAITLIRDVASQEGLVSSRGIVSTQRPSVQVDVTDLFNIRGIKAIPETKATVSTLSEAKQKNLFIEKYKDQTGTSNLSDQTGSMFKDLGTQRTRFDTEQQIKQKESQKNVLVLRTPQQELLKETTKQKQMPKEALSLINLLKTKQKYQQKQIQSQLIKQRYKQTQKPEIKLPKPLFFEGGLNKLKKRIETEPETFEVLGKRFGKEISLLKTSSKRKAEEETIKFLKGTLGRSARILESGKPIEFKELNLKSREFRPAKRESTRIVQEAKFSLGTGAEVKEIQYFKKKSKRSL